MENKSIPILKDGYYWYFEKASFNVANGYIRFIMYTITKTWRHVNSEGWEKFHDEMNLSCILQFASEDELYLSVSKIYKCLSGKSKWTTMELKTFLEKFKYHDFSIYEEKGIMDDCY